MLDVQREIQFVRGLPGFGDRLANAMQRFEDGINHLGVNIGADPTQTKEAPPTIQNLQVKSDGNGNVHAVITDNNAIQKNLHYFVEIQPILSGGTPAFSQPHVAHLGPSRTMMPIALPANDDNGNPQMYIFRGYSSYPGGKAGVKIHFGGTTPTPISPGGSAKMTFIPSTGAGTAQATGQQPGEGFGPVLFRPAIGPKRQS